jgi:hypothetical protein
MTQSVEGYVQLPPSGTGQGVRELLVTIIEPSTGAPTTVGMQVVALADKDGRAIDLGGDVANNLRRAMLRELRAIRSLLSQQVGSLALDSISEEVP